MIPYGRQMIEDDDIEAVERILKGDYLTTGPAIAEFEKALAEATGAKYAVAISNGTTALHAACFAAGIGPGDEVITSPMTFAASANCVLYCGGTPVFADINPDTYNISADDLRKKITSRTKAIIPVHFTGQPCEMDELLKIADEFSLKVIWDGAHGLGAKYKGRKIAEFRDMTTMSFHPVKHITTGEGGAILTDNKEFYEKMIMFRSHGITRDEDKMLRNEGAWYYEQQYLGNNYRMTDIQAALGISQLKKLDRFVERRTEIAKTYQEAFRGKREVVVPCQSSEGSSSWHIYVIQLVLEELKCDRRQFFDRLRSKGLGVNVHYIPVYYHPYYEKLGYQRGICKEAENLYNRIITLPLYPGMTDQEVEHVIRSVNETIEEYRK